MEKIFSRTESVLGKEAVEQLNRSRVALFGLGGVGGYCLEALVRSGVGNLDLFDGDVFEESNLNRHILSLQDTLGKPKAEIGKQRALAINPDVKIRAFRMFVLPENADEIDFSRYDYVIDAVDTVTAKIALIEQAKKANIPVISCMGAGNKKDPSAFQVCDIEKTNVCPLAKIMRRELKARGIGNVKAVFSTETAIRPRDREIGSFMPVVASAGLLLASEVIKDLTR